MILCAMHENTRVPSFYSLGPKEKKHARAAAAFSIKEKAINQEKEHACLLSLQKAPWFFFLDSMYSCTSTCMYGGQVHVRFINSVAVTFTV